MNFFLNVKLLFPDEIKAKETEIKNHKTEINKIKASVKKNNVLNLEMDAYEKSLKESSQKLEVKTLRVTEVCEISIHYSSCVLNDFILARKCQHNL